MRKALVCLLLALACAAHAETVTGRVVGVADGDTITVLDAHKEQASYYDPAFKPAQTVTR